MVRYLSRRGGASTRRPLLGWTACAFAAPVAQPQSGCRLASQSLLYALWRSVIERGGQRERLSEPHDMAHIVAIDDFDRCEAADAVIDV
jgi:hypothetical protein